MAVEPQFIRRWESQLAAYVSAGFKVSQLGNIGQQLIQLASKLVTLATLFFGARLVIDGRLNVGELVAFNMMAQRVSAPVTRLAQLWQEFQLVSISMSRLGDILNTRTELPQSRQALPPIQGNVSFDNIRFRYRPDGAPAVDGLSLNIPAGKVVGLVGRSGSGKSTLTKLLQRLYLYSGAGRRAHRRNRSRAGRSRVAAPADRRGAAGEPAVQPVRAREHRAERSRRATRSGHAGRETGGRA